MAEVTSSDTTNPTIPVVIEIPGARLTIEFDGQGQANLQTLAGLGQETLAAVFAFIANMNAPSAIIITDGLQRILADLVTLSAHGNLLQSLPRMQLMLDGLREIERFAEGPFSDPRIEGFEPARPERCDRLAPDHQADLPYYTGKCVDGRPVTQVTEPHNPYLS